LLRDLIEAIGRLELITKKLRAVIGVIVEEVELADVGEIGGDGRGVA
jgi:hypothetical protein